MSEIDAMIAERPDIMTDYVIEPFNELKHGRVRPKDVNQLMEQFMGRLAGKALSLRPSTARLQEIMAGDVPTDDERENIAFTLRLEEACAHFALLRWPAESHGKNIYTDNHIFVVAFPRGYSPYQDRLRGVA